MTTAVSRRSVLAGGVAGIYFMPYLNGGRHGRWLLGGSRRRRVPPVLLAARGHPDARIEQPLGANLRRVFGDSWGS